MRRRKAEREAAVFWPTQRGLFVLHWIGLLGAELEGSPLQFLAQSAAVFRSPRLQENLPLRVEQGRCCPAWATENGPDPQFRRVVLRHRKAQQGRNRFSGERSEPKPSGRLITPRDRNPSCHARIFFALSLVICWAHTNWRESSAVIGRARPKPCSSSTPDSIRKSRCSAVSTPSATTPKPSA